MKEWSVIAIWLEDEESLRWLKRLVEKDFFIVPTDVTKQIVIVNDNTDEEYFEDINDLAKDQLTLNNYWSRICDEILPNVIVLV